MNGSFPIIKSILSEDKNPEDKLNFQSWKKVANHDNSGSMWISDRKEVLCDSLTVDEGECFYFIEPSKKGQA